MSHALQKKHVLIFGDTISSRYDEEALTNLFAEEGIEIDLHVAKNLSDAVQTARDWKTQGVSPDIVAVDYENGYGPDFIEEYLEDEHMLPTKIFVFSNFSEDYTHRKLNSAFMDRLSPQIISNEDVLTFLKPFSHKHADSARRVLSYINDAWDINLPTSKQEAFKRNGNITGALPVSTFFDQKDSSLKDYGDGILELLDTDDIKNLFRGPTLENEAELERVSNIAASSFPTTINGTIAYSIKEARSYAAEGKAVILVANEDSSRTYLPVMGRIAAMVSLSPAFGHTTDSAEKNGVTSFVCSHNNDKKQNIAALTAIQHAAPSGTQVCITEEGLYKGHGILRQAQNSEDVEAQRSALARLIHTTRHKFQENGLNLHINADSAEHIASDIAQDLHVENVGLVRSENMLSDDDSLPLLQEYLLTDDAARRGEILSEFESKYRKAFDNLLGEADAQALSSVKIRLLDTKSEEVFPKGASHDALAATLGMSTDEVTRRIEALKTEESLGTGFGATHPEFYAMQARAIFAANAECEWLEAPSIMIPLMKSAKELNDMKDIIHEVAKEFHEELNYKFGAMIETKEALADIAEIAKITKFLSFGTNDLTASFLGISRYDGAASTDWAEEHDAVNPFVSLAPEVIDVMAQATLDAKAANPYCDIGMCGAHASDRASIKAARNMKLDSISVSTATHTLLTTAAIEAQGRIENAKERHNPSSRMFGASTSYVANTERNRR